MGNLISYYNTLKIKELIIISDPVNIMLRIVDNLNSQSEPVEWGIKPEIWIIKVYLKFYLSSEAKAQKRDSNQTLNNINF